MEYIKENRDKTHEVYILVNTHCFNSLSTVPCNFEALIGFKT